MSWLGLSTQQSQREFLPEPLLTARGCFSDGGPEVGANLTAGSVRTLAFFLLCWEVFTMSDSVPCAHLLSLKNGNCIFYF